MDESWARSVAGSIREDRPTGGILPPVTPPESARQMPAGRKSFWGDAVPPNPLAEGTTGDSFPLHSLRSRLWVLAVTVGGRWRNKASEAKGTPLGLAQGGLTSFRMLAERGGWKSRQDVGWGRLCNGYSPSADSHLPVGLTAARSRRYTGRVGRGKAKGGCSTGFGPIFRRRWSGTRLRGAGWRCSCFIPGSTR